MEPKFQHDCKECQFLGHFFKHDVYICDNGYGGSVIARHGDEGSDYGSQSIKYLNWFDSEQRIGLGDGESMNMQEFLFSDKNFDCQKAMMLGLIKLATICEWKC